MAIPTAQVPWEPEWPTHVRNVQRLIRLNEDMREQMGILVNLAREYRNQGYPSWTSLIEAILEDTSSFESTLEQASQNIRILTALIREAQNVGDIQGQISAGHPTPSMGHPNAGHHGHPAAAAAAPAAQPGQPQLMVLPAPQPVANQSASAAAAAPPGPPTMTMTNIGQPVPQFNLAPGQPVSGQPVPQLGQPGSAITLVQHGNRENGAAMGGQDIRLRPAEQTKGNEKVFR